VAFVRAPAAQRAATPDFLSEVSSHPKFSLSELPQSIAFRREQSGIAGSLEQIGYGAMFEPPKPHRLILVRGENYDSNLLPGTLQFPLENDSEHVRHGDVEDRTSGSGSRRLVVIDHGHESPHRYGMYRSQSAPSAPQAFAKTLVEVDRY
jgi:hypothetical protein